MGRKIIHSHFNINCQKLIYKTELFKLKKNVFIASASIYVGKAIMLEQKKERIKYDLEIKKRFKTITLNHSPISMNEKTMVNQGF